MDLEQIEKEIAAINEQAKKLRAEQDALVKQQQANASLLLSLNITLTEKKQILSDNTETIITISSFDGAVVKITTNGTPKAKVLSEMQATPTRYYNWSDNSNYFNIYHWESFIERVKVIPNVVINYEKDLDKVIDKYLHEPFWKTEYGEKYIIIHHAQRNKEFRSTLQKVLPTAVMNLVLKKLTVPFSEAWRLITYLQSQDSEIDEKTLALGLKQLEERKIFEDLSMLENAELHLDLNGYQLKPFQKVGVLFAEKVLGLA